MTGIVWSVIIGGIVGWLASIFMKTHRQMGILANVAVGIVGSSLGFWLFGLVGFGEIHGPASFVVRLIGALLFIALLKKLRFLR